MEEFIGSLSRRVKISLVKSVWSHQISSPHPLLKRGQRRQESRNKSKWSS